MSDHAAPTPSTAGSASHHSGLPEWLREVGVALGLDLAFKTFFPLVKKITGTLTHRDQEVLAEAKKLAAEGKHADAFKTLQRGLFGIGDVDEQIFDNDLAALVRSKPGLRANINRLIAILAANKKERDALRNTLTLDTDWRKRLELLEEYTRLETIEAVRERLLATGKLDPTLVEEVAEYCRRDLPRLQARNAAARQQLAQGYQSPLSQISVPQPVVRLWRRICNWWTN